MDRCQRRATSRRRSLLWLPRERRRAVGCHGGAADTRSCSPLCLFVFLLLLYDKTPRNSRIARYIVGRRDPFSLCCGSRRGRAGEHSSCGDTETGEQQGSHYGCGGGSYCGRRHSSTSKGDAGQEEEGSRASRRGRGSSADTREEDKSQRGEEHDGDQDNYDKKEGGGCNDGGGGGRADSTCGTNQGGGACCARCACCTRCARCTSQAFCCSQAGIARQASCASGTCDSCDTFRGHADHKNGDSGRDQEEGSSGCYNDKSGFCDARASLCSGSQACHVGISTTTAYREAERLCSRQPGRGTGRAAASAPGGSAADYAYMAVSRCCCSSCGRYGRGYVFFSGSLETVTCASPFDPQ